MQSEMSKLAQRLWSELQPLLLSSAKTEAAQRILDMFEEAGCRDLHECVRLTDTARESVLDGASAGFRIYDELGELDEGADFDRLEIPEDVGISNELVKWSKSGGRDLGTYATSHQ